MLSQKYDRFISPTIADRRWKEIVESSSRPHPFKVEDRDPLSQKFSGVGQTSYNSNFSVSSKQEYFERNRAADSAPPAGRPSFYREMLRHEVVDISQNKEYQAILASHMRSRQKEQFGSTNAK